MSTTLTRRIGKRTRQPHGADRRGGDPPGCATLQHTRMCLLLGFLLLTLALFGVGFTLHVLWWIALFALVFWLIGLFIRPGGGRWYYW